MNSFPSKLSIVPSKLNVSISIPCCIKLVSILGFSTNIGAGLSSSIFFISLFSSTNFGFNNSLSSGIPNIFSDDIISIDVISESVGLSK